MNCSSKSRTTRSKPWQGAPGTAANGGRVSVARLFDAIRTEMMASKFSQMFQQSLTDVPPAQRFEYYSRLNRRAKTEVMPLAVADFISQVEDPPTGELQTFFDAHKDQFQDPLSPDPGFKQPKRTAFQYFKADFEKFKEQFKSQVTDEENPRVLRQKQGPIPGHRVARRQVRRIETWPPDAEGTKSEEIPGADGEKPQDGDKPKDGETAPPATPSEEAKPAAPEDAKAADGKLTTNETPGQDQKPAGAVTDRLGDPAGRGAWRSAGRPKRRSAW